MNVINRIQFFAQKKIKDLNLISVNILANRKFIFDTLMSNKAARAHLDWLMKDLSCITKEPN
jgi:hypothetical protein